MRTREYKTKVRERVLSFNCILHVCILVWFDVNLCQ